MKKGLFIIPFLFYVTTFAQHIMPLYTGIIPDSKQSDIKEKEFTFIRPSDSIKIEGYLNVTNPTLTVFLPSVNKANGSAVIICPGGAYKVVIKGIEGENVAKKLNEAGIAAFVLKYRIPDDLTMVDKSIGPLQDAQRAMQLVRENAKKWHIDTSRIGIMGFSAGGHLASTVGTHFQKSYINNPKHTSLRPAFMILIYPVISFADSLTHSLTRSQLIGPDITPEKIKEYSNELQVTPQTPPTFISHAIDDTDVPVANSLYFIAALQQNHVPVEVFFYDKGGHGFFHVNPNGVQWIDNCIKWLKKESWLKK